jgi:hypothetical protein
LAGRRSRRAWESIDNEQLDDAFLSPNPTGEPRKPKNPRIFTKGTTARNDGIGGLFMMR